MKNIHLFETDAAYDAAKNGLILPTVSYIEDTKYVAYRPYHDYVEIAGIKWATMNVGAKSITDTGKYFQWGDTKGYTEDQIGTREGKKKFASDWSDYKWYDKETSALTKYYSGDNKTVLDLEDDAVHVNWGGSWRMPTKDDFQALMDAVEDGTVKPELKKIDGVFGLLLTEGKNELFFPVCGYAVNGSIYDTNCYWTSLLNTVNANLVYVLFGYDVNYISRYYGSVVRGVLDDNIVNSTAQK